MSGREKKTPRTGCVLFLGMVGGYIDLLTLRTFIKKSTQDLSTFRYVCHMPVRGFVFLNALSVECVYVSV